jgi:signal transduction histidine kinase
MHGSISIAGSVILLFPVERRIHLYPLRLTVRSRRDEIASEASYRGGMRGTASESRGSQHAEKGRQTIARGTDQITAAIAGAVNAEQVYEAVVDRVAGALGASSAGLWMLHSDGRTAQLVRSLGYHREATETLRAVPLDSARRFPALDAIARGEPTWIESVQQLIADYPDLVPLISGGRSYVVACLPLGPPDQTIGCLALTFENAPPIDPEQRDELMLVARYAGHALERLRLLQDAAEAQTRAELLHRLARAVITAQHVEQVYEAAIEALIQGVGASRASILLFDGNGVMRFHASHGLSPAYRAAVEGHSPWTRDEPAPHPIVVPDVEEDETLTDVLPVLRQEGIGALAFLPVMAAGKLLGKFMVYYDERPRALSPTELATACAVGDHVAAAATRFETMEELQRTVRFNEMFAGMLGHDLRNPLGAIMTAAQLLVLKSEQDKQITKPVARILSSGTRMSRMIDQLLDFTRVRVGAGIPLRRSRLDLAQLIRQVVEEIEMAHPDATVRIDHEGDGAGHWDEDRLSQVFSNLLANAVHHGSEGHPVTARVDGRSPDRVRIALHNRGAIPADVQPKLFEPMAGGERRWGHSQGLGLGLFIARQIIRAHSGTIEGRSIGDDTTFTVTLPRNGDAS